MKSRTLRFLLRREHPGGLFSAPSRLTIVSQGAGDIGALIPSPLLKGPRVYAQSFWTDEEKGFTCPLLGALWLAKEADVGRAWTMAPPEA